MCRVRRRGFLHIRLAKISNRNGKLIKDSRIINERSAAAKGGGIRNEKDSQPLLQILAGEPLFGNKGKIIEVNKAVAGQVG